MTTLKTLGVTEEQMEKNYLETWNKIDLVGDEWVEWEEKVDKMEGGEDGEDGSSFGNATSSNNASSSSNNSSPSSTNASTSSSIPPCKISATEKTGLAELNQLIEDKIVSTQGYKKRVVILELTDQPVLSWLWNETTVMSIDAVTGAEQGDNLMMVKVWMSPAAQGRFDKHFPDYVVKDL